MWGYSSAPLCKVSGRWSVLAPNRVTCLFEVPLGRKPGRQHAPLNITALPGEITAYTRTLAWSCHSATECCTDTPDAGNLFLRENGILNR